MEGSDLLSRGDAAAKRILCRILTLAEAMTVSYQTARYRVFKLVDLGILRPLEADGRGRRYVAADIFRLMLERGSEFPGE